MDNLEEHIRNNREDLDMYQPSPEVWSKIRKDLKVRRPVILRRWSVAAMFIVVLGTAFFLVNTGRKKDADYRAENKIDPSLRETEFYYNTMVNNLYREAQPLMMKQPVIEKEINTGMAQLDSIYSDLKKDLKDNVSNQEVVEALIQNYRIKIQLLEEMLNLLKENENGQVKTKGHEM